MAASLNKQPLTISFGQGLDQKVDPWQVQAGKFLELENGVFLKAGLLQKRDGFGDLPAVPSMVTVTKNPFTGEIAPLPQPPNGLALFGDSLMATGAHLQSFNPNAGGWTDRGSMQSIDLRVRPAVRTAASQTVCDSAQTDSGIVCVAYTDATVSYYQVIQASNGQILKAPTALGGTVAQPRVFLLGAKFIITYLVTVGGTTHLRAVSLPASSLIPYTVIPDLLETVVSLTGAYDGVVANNALYVVAADATGGLTGAYLGADLAVHASPTVIEATAPAAYISMAVDKGSSPETIWLTRATATDVYSSTLDSTYLTTIISPVHSPASLPGNALAGITTAADSGVLYIVWQMASLYYSGGPRSDFVEWNYVDTTSGTPTTGTNTIVARSVGLASRLAAVAVQASVNTERLYVLLSYAGGGSNTDTTGKLQPTYFLSDLGGNIVMRLAESNGAGYPTTGVLPTITASGQQISFVYLYKDLVTVAAPLTQSDGSLANTTNIYTQNAVNYATATLNAATQEADIGGSLHLSGGLLFQFDGAKLVEHGFNLYPEDLWGSGAHSGGYIPAQITCYVATYEWTDAAGQIHRSAPSVPFYVDNRGSSGADTNTVNVPTLRLTAKTGANAVRIVLYRWNSIGDQVYHQVSLMATPTLNNITIDYVTFTDTYSNDDAQKGAILYTTGGVLENICTPAIAGLTLAHTRLFYIDAEDRNRIGYSKQVIENTPVETSDNLSFYVPPSTGVAGSTGECTVLYPMDDKLIIFKDSALYYQVGTGPDNTGANNDFSEPAFITAAVGCSNPNSVILTPNGVMFQSDKGIWLLGRDLSTDYIGAPVEDLTKGAKVLSAVAPPETNEIRLNLDSGVVLVYDYYWKQWGTFTGIPGVSSVVYNKLHTYITADGLAYQQTPGKYLDGSSPVLLKLKTSWLKLSGLQGYQRAWMFYILGRYLTPHRLQVSIASDYEDSPNQITIIQPDNFNPTYGTPSPYGAESPYGGPSNLEKWRVFITRQKCESVQIAIEEMYDATLGVPAGQGLTLSGLNLVVGIKKGYSVLKPSRSIS